MKNYLVIFFVIFNVAASAQDPHFSQYYSSPLTLNPALTGFTDADSRLQLNFRNQYWSVGKPFTTGTISYDTKLHPQSMNENDKLGIGFLGMYDCSSGGGFKNVNIAVSGSYHKSLDEDGFKTLGVGFQGSYASRKITFEGLHFANQFTSGGFDPSLPSNESNLVSTKNYVDLNAGILYSVLSDFSDFYIGSSLYHINQPNVTFRSDANYRLPMRFTIHGGAHFNVGMNNQLFFSGNYMYQAKAYDGIIGAAYGYNLMPSEEGNNHNLYGGLWYRYKESFIPYLGLEWGNKKWGLSYDIINSDLKMASPKTGSFEFSLYWLLYKEVNPYNKYQRGRY